MLEEVVQYGTRIEESINKKKRMKKDLKDLKRRLKNDESDHRSLTNETKIALYLIIVNPLELAGPRKGNTIP